MSGRIWLLVGAACVVLSGLYAWTALPEGQVPTHWGTGSAPDGWSSRNDFLLTYLLMCAGIGAVMLLLARMFSSSKTLNGINVPGKEYWRKPENIGRARTMAVKMMYEITGMTWVFMAMIPLSVVAAVRDPRHALPGWFIAAIFVFIGGTLAWTFLILRRWRVPPDA